MHESAFKALILAWSYGVVLSNRQGRCYLSYEKTFVPNNDLIRALKYHKETLLKSLPEEVD